MCDCSSIHLQKIFFLRSIGVCRRRLHGEHLVRSQENLSKILKLS